MFHKNKAFYGRSFISIDGLTPSLIQFIFHRADTMRTMSYAKTRKILEGKLVTILFFEPSSRTFSSFSAAVKKLGGMTLEYQNPMQTSSAVKGETLEDTMKVFAHYSQAIVMRHFETGTLLKASQAVTVPVINAADGIGEHPTQALLDAYTIYRHTKRLSGITGLMAGDLLYGRTVHSLLKLLSLYKNNTIYLLSPKRLAILSDLRDQLRKNGLKLIEIEKTDEIPVTCDFWYWTRVQKERFTSKREYEQLKNSFVITPELLREKGNKKLILLHPLPRIGDIDTRIDSDPRALYLTKQVENGLIIRMALLSLILGNS